MKRPRPVPDRQRDPLPFSSRTPENVVTGPGRTETWKGWSVLDLQRAAGNSAVSDVVTELNGTRATHERDSADEQQAVMVAEGGSAASHPATARTGRPSTSATGERLGDTVRAPIEQQVNASIEHVRVHSDDEAGALAAGLGAKAFTFGSDIYFGAGHYDPGSSDGRRLLTHEVTHTLAQNKNPQVMRAPGPLSAAQEADAIAFTNARYDERSVRIIQITTGSAITGAFDDITAQAVATFQTAQGGLLVDGKLGPRTMNRVVPDRAAADLREHAIQLVIDLNNLDVTSDTLAVHFDPALAAARATTFEPGRLRIVRVGATAFTNHTTLLNAISAGLRTAAPRAPSGGARPAVLNPADEAAAIASNRVRLSDLRSARAVQGHVRSNPEGLWGPDTVQRVAQAQGAAGLPATGIIDEATLQLLTTQMIAAGNMNAPIRLIIDFFDLADDNNLLSVFFDATVAANASTDFRPDEPVRVRVGPSGMAQPFAGVVHTIAHEFEHVRQLHAGERSRFVHEFLGEAVEVVSAGLPTEVLESTPADPGAFADDAQRALDNWNLMTPAEQSTHRARFLEVRQAVRDRIAAGTPAQQLHNAPMLTNYNAVVVPP